MKPIWVVQKNLANEDEYPNFISAIEKTGSICQIVKVVPFAHDLIPPIETTSIVAFGTMTLEGIAKQLNWSPGTFSNEKHNFEYWSEGYSGFLLNDDAKIHPFGSVPKFEGVRFIRPLDDSKVFAGQVIEGSDFANWHDQVLAIQDDFSTLTMSTKILIASTKEIKAEYRFFVVDSQVVTGSLYRQHNRTKKERIKSNHRAWSFAADMVNRWKPGKHFVIDVCQMPDDSWKIVEINSLNSSGFYNCDSSKIVNGLHEWMNKNAQ